MKTTTLYVAFLIAAYLFMGFNDYRDKAPRYAPATTAAPERAPIWSRRCERQGKDTLVKVADSNPPEIHCLPRRVLTVLTAAN